MKTNRYVIGLDFGTDSCRALVVDTVGGRPLASEVVPYPRWKAGLYCNPAENRYRQHPLDYIESLEKAVRGALARCPEGTAAQVAALAFATTGSTPVLLDESGTPLALRPEFADNPNAMFVLWKDHTALREAAEINALARRWPVDYTAYCGGVYSAEWVWSKMLHLLRADASLRPAAYSWAEHCDWMPALLTGRTRPETMIRSRCAAGHKAMWHAGWGGLPPAGFLHALDPLLDGFAGHLYSQCHTSDTVAGTLAAPWATRLGLRPDVVVAAGAIDCHMGAVGAGIAPGSFVRVIGTSTCDIMIASREAMAGRRIEGICGQVDGSVVPGYIGLEAGQSAFGDLYAWFEKLLLWPAEQLLAASALVDEATKTALVDEMADQLLPALGAAAEKIGLDESGPLALDWLNGRRTPVANQAVKGVVEGLTLGTTAPRLYRALVEATAFGSRAIVESFRAAGLPIDTVVAIGGISLKSPLVMQILADVLGMPIRVARAEQACALGAAMFAAVAAGMYPDVAAAGEAMGQGTAFTYRPDPARHAAYGRMYARYRKLGAFTEKELYGDIPQ